MRNLQNNNYYKSYLIDSILLSSSSFFFCRLIFFFHPVNIYMFKVNNRNTRQSCKICSKLTIKTPDRRQCRRSVFFIVIYEHISHLFLLFLLLSLSRYLFTGHLFDCTFFFISDCDDFSIIKNL